MRKSFNWLSTINENKDKLFFILGPCAIENETHSLKAAEFLKQLAEKLNISIIFKSSFDKANRLSLKSYRSVGIDAGLSILSKVRSELDMPVITDVHEVAHVAPTAEVVDVLQIPAMLCRQTDLLVACGKTGKPTNIKKGQFMTAEAMEHAAIKLESSGIAQTWLCERGVSFGYNNLVVDYRNFPIMKRFKRPIVFDATHSVQKPAAQGISSGGDRSFVPGLAAAAVTQGIAGVFMEVHEDPDNAPCDGPNSVRFANLEALLRYLIDLDEWTKQRPSPESY